MIFIRLLFVFVFVFVPYTGNVRRKQVFFPQSSLYSKSWLVVDVVVVVWFFYSFSGSISAVVATGFPQELQRVIRVSAHTSSSNPFQHYPSYARYFPSVPSCLVGLMQRERSLADIRSGRDENTAEFSKTEQKISCTRRLCMWWHLFKPQRRTPWKNLYVGEIYVGFICFFVGHIQMSVPL